MFILSHPSQVVTTEKSTIFLMCLSSTYHYFESFPYFTPLFSKAQSITDGSSHIYREGLGSDVRGRPLSHFFSFTLFQILTNMHVPLFQLENKHM